MPAITLLTLGQFYELPSPEAGKLELMEGQVIEAPPAKSGHTRIATRIDIALRHYLECTGQDPLRALREAGFQLESSPASWLVPDVAVLYENQRDRDYFEGAPLLAVEVVSASNSPGEIQRKVRLYLTHGGGEVWVVNPRTKAVQVHTAGDPNPTRYQGNLKSALFPGLELDLNRALAS